MKANPLKFGPSSVTSERLPYPKIFPPLSQAPALSLIYPHFSFRQVVYSLSLSCGVKDYCPNQKLIVI